MTLLNHAISRGNLKEMIGHFQVTFRMAPSWGSHGVLRRNSLPCVILLRSNLQFLTPLDTHHPVQTCDWSNCSNGHSRHELERISLSIDIPPTMDSRTRRLGILTQGNVIGIWTGSRSIWHHSTPSDRHLSIFSANRPGWIDPIEA